MNAVTNNYFLLGLPPHHSIKSKGNYNRITCAKNKKEKDLVESTGVVLAKYPPKVKLELFS